jgi:intracellular sulfur oxidation DsrE/DsrF family protein
MRGMLVFIMLVLPAVAYAEDKSTPTFVHPRIKNYGGVVALEKAAEPPRAGAKVVFDLAGEGKADEVHPGLERVARYLNLHAQAGHRAADLQVALVLHGQATQFALNEKAYAKQASGASNPNLDLLRQLKTAGIELYVCGQSLARNGYRVEEVAPDLVVAVSAMTVNINKQLDGYAYLPIH